MKQFASIAEAFDWWLKNIYPNLTAAEKSGKYRNAWRDYTFKKGISSKRMKNVLSDFAELEERTVVTLTLK